MPLVLSMRINDILAAPMRYLNYLVDSAVYVRESGSWACLSDCDELTRHFA